MKSGAKRSRSGSTQSLAVAAYVRLEEMIILGELRPDLRLSEQMLAQKLGLGRTPIREALQKLRANNLVEIRPQSGVFVTKIDFRSQLLVFEVRRELEVLVASRAARRANADQRRELLRLSDDMRESARVADKNWLMNVDREFKEQVIAAAHNVYLEASLAPIFAHSRRFYFSHLPKTNLQIASSHADAISAIASGDEALAVVKTGVFLDEVEAFTKTVITAELAAM